VHKQAQKIEVGLEAYIFEMDVLITYTLFEYIMLDLFQEINLQLQATIETLL
jgi:hypothetical protein